MHALYSVVLFIKKSVLLVCTLKLTRPAYKKSKTFKTTFTSQMIICQFWNIFHNLCITNGFISQYLIQKL